MLGRSASPDTGSFGEYYDEFRVSLGERIRRMQSKYLLTILAGTLLASATVSSVSLGQSRDAPVKNRNDRVSASKHFAESRRADEREKQRRNAFAKQQKNATTPSSPEGSSLGTLAAADKQKLRAHSASFSKSKPGDQDSEPQDSVVQLAPDRSTADAPLGAVQTPDDADSDDASGESDEEEDEDEEDEPEPWTLFQLPRLEQRDIHVRGWLAQGFTWNPDRPQDRSNGVLGMNDRSNDYLFNQLGLTIENPVEEDPCNWSLGWKVGLMYGSDARFVQSLGFDDEWISGRYVSLAMPELFADIFVPWANGASVRVGRFWSPIGYEGVPALDRFFHSATNVFMLAEPSTHTGALLKYPLNERWTVQGGVVQGWDVWNDNNDSLGALGTLSWLSEDEKTSVTGVFYRGDETDDINDNQCTYSFMFTHELNECWSYLFWHDYNTARDVAVNSSGGPKDGQWFSITNALFYAVDEEVSVGARLEYYRDDDGVTIYHPISGDNLGPGDLYGLTLGLNYTPTLNLLIRPEFRWDWSNRVVPYDDQSDGQQFTGSCDVVWQF